MKKKLLFALVSCMLLLSACGNAGDEHTADNALQSETTIETKTGDTTSLAELNAAIEAQPVFVQGEYSDIDYLWLLNITNNSDADIKNIRIAYVCWDDNNLPEPFENTSENYSEYVAIGYLNAVNIPAGGTYSCDNLYLTPENDEVNFFMVTEKMKFIIKNYTDFYGNTWENPCYEAWCNAYAGKKLIETTTIATTTIETTTEITTSLAELNAAIAAQPVFVQDTKYVNRKTIRDKNTYYRESYCDFLSPIIKNNSGTDVKNVKIAYAAWDANNLPLKIDGYYDFINVYEKNHDYIVIKNLEALNIRNGGAYEYTLTESDESIHSSDDDAPFLISYYDDTNIAKCKSVVVSYEDFDGNIWENPCYETWCNAYEGKKLNE